MTIWRSERGYRYDVRRRPTDVAPKVAAGGVAGVLVTFTELALSGTFDWKLLVVVVVSLAAAYLKADRV